GLELASDSADGQVQILSADPSGPAAGMALPASLRSLEFSGREYLLQPADVIEEPDLLGANASISAFYQRQEALHQALLAGELQVSTVNPQGEVLRYALVPGERPLS